VRRNVEILHCGARQLQQRPGTAISGQKTAIEEAATVIARRGIAIEGFSTAIPKHEIKIERLSTLISQSNFGVPDLEDAPQLL
jgi:hypothetical protein